MAQNPTGNNIERLIRQVMKLPRDFREQGNMAINVLGTWEQKHILGNREHQNRRITFREHGNTRTILLGIREHGPPGKPSVKKPDMK